MRKNSLEHAFRLRNQRQKLFTHYAVPVLSKGGVRWNKSLRRSSVFHWQQILLQSSPLPLTQSGWARDFVVINWFVWGGLPIMQYKISSMFNLTGNTTIYYRITSPTRFFLSKKCAETNKCWIHNCFTIESVTIKSESQDRKVMPSKVETYNFIYFQDPMIL